MEGTAAPSPPPTTPRHLKRLSLSTFSSSPLTSASSTPRTPGSARSHAPRDLRLSMSGGASPYSRDSPTSAPADGSSSSFLTDELAQVTSGDSWAFPDSSFSGSPARPTLSPTTSRPLRSGNARRTSSISYSSSSPREGGHEGRSSPNFSGHFPTLSYSSSSSSSPLASPTLGSRNSGIRDLNGQRSAPSADRVPTGVVVGLDNLVEEEEEEEGEVGSTPGKLDMRGPVVSELSDSRSGLGSISASTITEVNADLLSFIAKKERKCLDLREELKRHEDELVALKKKWESIVAKSVAAAALSQAGTTVPSTSSPRFSESSRRLFNRASPVTRSTSNAPLPRIPNHALDISLLSSTFDPVTFDPSLKPEAYGSADLEAELGESVQAAKAWMGGVLGKVFEAVGGIDGIPDDATSHKSSKALEGVEEESEAKEAAIVVSSSKSALSASGTSTSTLDEDWARSRTSIESSVSVESASSFFGQFNPDLSLATAGSTKGRPTAFTQGSDLRNPQLPDPISSSQSPMPPLNLNARPPPSRTRSSGDAASHNRRRSTFDILGSAAGGSWNTLNKKWAAASTSEIYKSSRAAALNAVDSFERRLTETLGPLEGSPHTSRSPPSTPMKSSNPQINQSPANVSTDSWNTSAPQSAARRESSKAAESLTQRSDTGSAEWDWTAFLGDTDGGKGKAQQNLLDLETSLPNTLPSPLSPAPVSPVSPATTPTLGSGRFRAFPRTSPSRQPAKETDEWASW